MLNLKHIFKVLLLIFITILTISYIFGEYLYAKDVGRIVYGKWTENDNPYDVTASLLIPIGKTLTIKEGVKIYFKEGLGIKVKGDLIIQGSDSKKVLFSSKDETNEEWNGIVIESGGNLKIKHCLIEHATNAITVSGADSVKIEECIIEHADYAITVSNARSVIIKQSLIKHATHHGIDVSGGYDVSGRYYAPKAVIDGCVIMDGLIFVEGSKSIITNNEIKGRIYINSDSCIIRSNTITIGAFYYRGEYVRGGGIIIGNSKNDNLIEDNTIETNYEDTGIKIELSDGNKIIGNNITKCSSGIWIGGESHEISKNVITDNKRDGIYFELIERNNTVFNNIIVGNNGFGINISDERGGDIKINQNEIHGNTEGELHNQSSAEIDATNNWWGTSDESKITSRIFDYFQDATKGIVNFQPYLKASPSHK